MQAVFDLDAVPPLDPDAQQVQTIRATINKRGLRARDHGGPSISAHLRHHVAGIAALVLAASCLDSVGQGAETELRSPLDHIGTWNCVLYGHPAFGNERVLFRFQPDGGTRLARPSEDVARPWTPLSQWQVDATLLSFSDSRTGRDFEADLARTTLGGTWRTRSLIGGWWCSAVDRSAAEVEDLQLAAREGTALMPALIPEIMATPRYPNEAIQQRIEGRAVVCFFVDARGTVFDPEVIELSHEIFRAPTLDALLRSRYRSWASGQVNRPACRSYIYRLDAVY